MPKTTEDCKEFLFSVLPNIPKGRWIRTSKTNLMSDIILRTFEDKNTEAKVRVLEITNVLYYAPEPPKPLTPFEKACVELDRMLDVDTTAQELDI